MVQKRYPLHTLMYFAPYLRRLRHEAAPLHYACLFSQFSRSLVNLSSEEHWTNRCRPRLLLVVNLVTRGRVPQMSTDPKPLARGAPINPDKNIQKGG